MIFSLAAIAERKKRVALNFSSFLKDNDVVLIFSGEPIRLFK